MPRLASCAARSRPVAECPYCNGIDGVKMHEKSTRHWYSCQWCSRCGAFFDGRSWRKPKGKGG